jgi:hypothetical protein
MIIGGRRDALETPFKLFGYPGLAILFFLAAAAGGCALMYDIMFHDEGKKTGPA